MNTIALRVGTASLIAAAVVGAGLGTASAAPIADPAPVPATLAPAPQPLDPVALQLLGYGPLQRFLICITTGSFANVCQA